MSYITSLYGTQSNLYTNDSKPKQTANSGSGFSFAEILQGKNQAEGWPTQKQETKEQILENRLTAIKDAYKNNSVSAMLDSAKNISEQLKTQFASQEMQIRPTPTLTSILSKA